MRVGNSQALLAKYQSQVESHLDKVSLQLDEDIAAMVRPFALHKFSNTEKHSKPSFEELNSNAPPTRVVVF